MCEVPGPEPPLRGEPRRLQPLTELEPTKVVIGTADPLPETRAE
jgi:hypothetical protein